MVSERRRAIGEEWCVDEEDGDVKASGKAVVLRSAAGRRHRHLKPPQTCQPYQVQKLLGYYSVLCTAVCRLNMLWIPSTAFMHKI